MCTEGRYIRQCVLRAGISDDVYWGQVYQTIKGKVSSVCTTPYFNSSLLCTTYTSTTYTSTTSNLVSSPQYNDIHCKGFPLYNDSSHICLPINPTLACLKMNFIAVHVTDGEWKEKLTSAVVNRKGFVTWPPSLVLWPRTLFYGGAGSNSSHHTSWDQLPWITHRITCVLHIHHTSERRYITYVYKRSQRCDKCQVLLNIRQNSDKILNKLLSRTQL